MGYKKASSRLRRAFIKLPRFFPYVFNKNSLDFGCGGGFVAYALSFIAKSSVGVDINQKAVTYAKKKNSTARRGSTGRQPRRQPERYYTSGSPIGTGWAPSV